MDGGSNRRKKGIKATMESEVQNAVDQTGYGKFHYKLFVICAMIFMNTGLGVSCSGLIVPAAACDFEMTTINKGRLTAAPMLGMVCGSYFWGCLADMKGRKVALLAALYLDGFAGAVASLVPNFWVFTFLRFLNGFAITGQCAMLFPYLGEFQPTRLREKILCWLEMAWTMGITILPLLGWLIIPMKFHYRSGDFSFASWNLFVLACALPSLSCGIALLFFPESPKYLIENGQDTKAIKILADMYAENTRNPSENYPIKFIRREDESTAPATCDFTTTCVKTKRKKKELRKMLLDIVEHTLTILKPPYQITTLLTSTIQFSMTSSYYTLMVWFPELFQRFAEFEKHHPHESASVCGISAKPINETMINKGNDFGCDTELQSSVYTHTIFLGLACIPTSIWLPLCIGRLGYRFFLVFSTVCSGAAAVGLFFVTSSLQNLILSCIFEAVTSMGVSVVYCILVDFYPTHLRVIAASFSALFGRSGALLGNLMFGYLLDLHCVVPIAAVGGLLLSGGVLSLFLPGRGKVEATNKLPTTSQLAWPTSLSVKNSDLD